LPVDLSRELACRQRRFKHESEVIWPETMTFVVHHVSFLFVASSGSDILTDDPLISGLLSVQIGFHPYFQKRFLVDSPELHKIY
jgi:hypothetical protein